MTSGPIIRSPRPTAQAGEPTDAVVKATDAFPLCRDIGAATVYRQAPRGLGLSLGQVGVGAEARDMGWERARRADG